MSESDVKKETRGRKKGCKNPHKKKNKNILDEPPEVKHLRKVITTKLAELNSDFTLPVVTFSNANQLDCCYGYSFKATGTGYVTYALNTECNRSEERLNYIRNAREANYQRNGFGYLWSYKEVFEDVLSIIAAGITEDKDMELDYAELQKVVA